MPPPYHACTAKAAKEKGSKGHMDALNMSIWRVQPCFRDHILNAIKKLSVVNAAKHYITVENQEADEPLSSPDIGTKITSRKLQMGDST